MRIYGWLLAFLFSLNLSAQKVVRFSTLDQFSEEFTSLVKLPKEDKALFADSLLPDVQYAIDEDSERDWITLCNNMLRKRITEPETWEELFRLTAFINNNEEYGTLLKVINHLNGYIRSNPSSRTKDYISQLFSNIVRHRFYDNNDLIWKAPYSEWSMQFEGKELFFNIGEGDIIGRFREDSTIVMGTSGRFFPRTGTLEANGGTVFWGRVGKSEDELYGELASWSLDTRQGYFKADSATLNHP